MKGNQTVRTGSWLEKGGEASKKIFLFVALCLLLSTRAWAAPRQTLPGHLPVDAQDLQPIGRLPGSTQLRLAIGLPLRNQATLTNLLREIYDPASPNYHHYLAPEQFAEKFGPSKQDYATLTAFAQAHGLSVASTHPNRTVLDVGGSVADIENAFHVNLRVYQHPTESRTFFAPDTTPSLDLDVPVLDVIGLDNYFIPRPASLRSVPVEQAGQATPMLGSGINGTYLGNDFRAAYVPGTALTGAGQRVGLLELDGYFFSDITNYEALAGLPNVPLTNVLLDGFSGLPGRNNDEVALDIEMVIAMAPGLAGVIVYEETNSSNSVPIDILNRMATDNLASQLSSSWNIGDNLLAQNVYLQFQTQGQSFFQSSGDDGAYHQGTNQQSADDPYITIVGGTVLTTTGPGGAWVSETTWPGSGGGISLSNAIPIWQQGFATTTNQGSPTLRNVPDVAMVASNILSIADNGQTNSAAGTSAAAPLWAGFAALVNQQNTAAVGFFNPALYALAKTSNYMTDFHDITTGNNTNSSSSNRFFAMTGYDLCTGLGTPSGTNLISKLAVPFQNILASGGLITFSANKTIAPVSPYQITNNIILDGTGFNVTFSGSVTSAVFVVHSGVSFSATNITFTGCKNVGVTGASGQTNSFSGNIGNAGSPGSAAQGGAIYNQGNDVFVDCMFLDNNATGGNGGTGSIPPPSGGLQGGSGGGGGNGFGGAIYNLGTLLLSNSTFTGNTTVGGNGGVSPSGTQGGSAGGLGGLGNGAALYNVSGASAIILACTFNNNSATGGNTQQAGGSFSGNIGNTGAAGGVAQGGAIFNLGTNTMLNSTFYQNAVMGGTGGAGGIAPPAAGNNGLGGNGGSGGAAYGGSIYNGGLVNVTNCTFNQGSAVGGTGGAGTTGPFRAGSNGGTGPGYGANLDNASGTFNLKNSTLAYPNNAANAYGSITDAGNNISSDATPTFVTTNSHDNLDPKLATLSSNGGFTETVALLPGSPAIDAIYDGSAPSVDQRGVPRPNGPRPDIGAFEYASAPYFTLSLNAAGQLSGSTTPNMNYRIQTSSDLITWQNLALCLKLQIHILRQQFRRHWKNHIHRHQRQCLAALLPRRHSVKRLPGSEFLAVCKHLQLVLFVTAHLFHQVSGQPHSPAPAIAVICRATHAG